MNKSHSYTCHCHNHICHRHACLSRCRNLPKSQTEIARKSLIAPLIGELIDIYHTDEMANRTINLLRWWKEKGDAFATAFAEEKKSHLAKGNSLQDAFPI